MFRHTVLFRFKDGTTSEQTEAISVALGQLPSIIGQIRSYSFGPDAAVNPGNFDFAVTGTFDSVDDYLVYRDHPEHQRFVKELVVPVLESRAAVQFSEGDA